MRVAAVVVTYNREELLAKTLAGLEQQERPIDTIIIVNNASTDDTAQMLATRKVAVPTVVITEKVNTGGAGGFTRGIEEAYARGFDAFWLMDDDTVPRPRALGSLLEGLEGATELRGETPSFACSSVLWTDGSLCEMNTPEPTWDWSRPLLVGKDWVDVKSCSFVSCLVTREAVHAVGLPYREYFIWFDDAEYTLRLTKFRPGVYIPSSEVDHLLPTNRGVNYGDIDESNIWKFEYGLRNQMSAAWSLRSPTIAASMVENLLKQMRGAGVSGRLKLKVLRAIWRGIWFHPKKRFARTVR